MPMHKSADTHCHLYFYLQTMKIKPEIFGKIQPQLLETFKELAISLAYNFTGKKATYFETFNNLS